jgi:hypothetical protein
MTARANCHMCTYLQSDPLALFGRCCVKSSTLQQILYLQQLFEDARNDPTLTVLYKQQELQLGLVSEKNDLFTLKYCDPHCDSPIEILHTIALGACKYAVLAIMGFIKEKPKETRYHMLATIAARIDDIDQTDSRDSLSPKAVIEHVAAHVGRDCKMLMHYGVYIFRDIIITDGVLNLLGQFLCASARLTRHVYSPTIKHVVNFTLRFTQLLENWCTTYAAYDAASFARKHKPHTMYHIPECVARFGPLRLYATEIFERENGDMRQRISKTNHQKVTRDMLNVYVKEHVAETFNNGTFVLCKTTDDEYFSKQFVPLSSIVRNYTPTSHVCFRNSSSVNGSEAVNVAFNRFYSNTDIEFEESRSAYTFLRLHSTDKVAKCGRSWMIFRTANDDDCVGLLITLIANKIDGSNGVACFEKGVIQNTMELFGNRKITKTSNLECVSVHNIKRICSVQRECSACAVNVTQRFRGDLDNKKILYYQVQHTCRDIVLNSY